MVSSATGCEPSQPDGQQARNRGDASYVRPPMHGVAETFQRAGVIAGACVLAIWKLTALRRAWRGGLLVTWSAMQERCL
jgi:hypothetical protein